MIKNCVYCSKEFNATNKDQKWCKPSHKERFRDKITKRVKERRLSKKGRTSPSVINKFSVFDRDDYICQICFKPIVKNLPPADWQSATLDHIIPISAGGLHTMDNLQAAHKICNLKKSDKLPEVM